MEEAIVDSTLDLNLSPAEYSIQSGVQGDMRTDTGDQAQFLTSVQKGCQEAVSQWPQTRAERVESLRQRVTSGVYQVDSAELAQCIWNNSTRFLETHSGNNGTRLAVAETR